MKMGFYIIYMEIFKVKLNRIQNNNFKDLRL